MSKLIPHKIFLQILIGSTFLYPALSQAANNTPDIENYFDLSLEELMNVTIVSLFEETRLDTSSSVYIVEEEQWLKKGIRRSNEIMSYQPGTVSFTTLGGSNVFAIRGFANTLSSRGVATLLDGVPLNTFSFGTAQYFLSNFDIGTLKKAELVRGPGSAIYGSDAFHGVFALQTFASDKDIIESELGMGSPGYSRFNTRFSQALNNRHRMHGGIAGTHQSSSDIVFNDPNSNDQGLRQDAYTSHSAFLTSDNKINSQWSSHIGFYYNDWNSDDFPSIGSNLLATNDVSDAEAEFYMISADAVRSLSNNKTLELKAFHWHTDQEFHYEFSIPLQAQEDQRHGISITLKQPGNKNTPRWLAGAGTNEQEILSARTINGTQAFDGLDRTINNLFTQIRIPWNDNKLALDLGARLDDYSDFGSQFTPRLGLIYKPEINTALKLLYGNAFRAPVGSELTSSGQIQGNPDLKPETIDTYELVLMQQTENSHASMTLFYSEWEDAIVIVNDATLAAPFNSRYANQGLFKSRGIELEYSLKHKAWAVDSGLSFLKSKNGHSDETFVAFPETIANLNFSYALPSSSTVISLTNQAWFNVHATPAQSSDQLDSIWLSNLNITHSWSANMDLAIDIRDVFNRQDTLPSLWGNAEGIPGNGTEFAAYIRIRW